MATTAARAMTPPLSVVIPSRDEARHLPQLLAQLQAAPQLVREVLVVDGGSRDGSASVAELGGAVLLRSAPGRGRQLALGVAAAEGPWLLLLHADAALPPGWAARLQAAIGQRRDAWYFDLAIAGRQPALRLVELAVALRSRWRQQPYGDQGLLVTQELLQAVGGVRPLPLMEDLDLVLRLARLTRLRSLGLPLQVSDRRWRQLGVWGTGLRNLQLRRAWRGGISTRELARRYYGS
jgi:rSAM/selenodomain-associated transferase 2